MDHSVWHLAGLAAVALRVTPAWAAGGGAAAAKGPVKVEVRKEGAGFRLYRGGEPYYIKGAVYWSSPRGRFPLAGIVQRGGNSVRCGAHIDETLEEAARLGATVTLGLRMKMEAVHGFDYGDANAVAAQFEQVKATVLKCKDHPAVLMWGIGNELSMGYRNKKVWDAVNAVAEFIHKVDPYHPTMTVIGGGHKLEESADILRQAPAVDVLGVNFYKGLETVPARLREVGWPKPYVITEWGPSGHWQVPKTAWRAAVEETSTEKAERYKERYENTMRKDTERCLGSYVFFWQHKQETTHTWYGMFLAGGERTEAVNVMQQLWTGKWPANRASRIDSLTLDGKAATDSVVLDPGTAHEAVLAAADPDGDEMTYQWEFLPEATKLGYGGMGERKPLAVKGLVKSASGGKLAFTAPEAPGPYRLFAVVLDGQGNAATANIPFHVGPVPKQPLRR